MSIKIMSKVWQHSAQEGGKLLILLAIADFADENGHAYPSINTLAKKARLTIRHTRRVIRKLAKANELIIHAGKGLHGTNLYQVIICQDDNLSGVTSDASGDDIPYKEGMTPASPNPSYRTVKEPIGHQGHDTPWNEAGWTQFWEAWPKKVAKREAIRAWNKLKPNPELLATILQRIATSKQSEQWQRNGGQYIPHPATWINGRRWEDALVIPAPPQPIRHTEVVL